MTLNSDYWIERLSRPLRKNFFSELLTEPCISPECCAMLYTLSRHDSKTVAWRALWACEKLCRRHKGDFTAFRTDLTARLQTENHDGMKRVMLSLLLHMPPVEPTDARLYDFCLQRMLAPQETAAVQTLCQKLAHRIASREPLLQNELIETLSFGNLDFYPPSVRSSAHNILKKLTRNNNKKDDYNVFR